MMAAWWQDLIGRAGGAARLRVIALLAAVLGLSGADTGTISSVASNLERAFSISNTDIGILLSVVMLVGAAGTVPVGSLTDRVNRTRLLAFSIGLWAVATVASAAAMSFAWLLAARVALGVVTATGGPTVASLTGDYFPAAERGRIYGWVVSGELLGVAVGLMISGQIASGVGWRAAVAACLSFPGPGLSAAGLVDDRYRAGGVVDAVGRYRPQVHAGDSPCPWPPATSSSACSASPISAAAARPWTVRVMTGTPGSARRDRQKRLPAQPTVCRSAT
jgi:MFS family permease